MAIKTATETVLTAAAASINQQVYRSPDFQRAAFLCSTTGGQWDFFLEASIDQSNWFRVSSDLTLNGTTDTIFLVGSFPFLRINATMTAGTADVVVVYSGGKE